MKNERVKELQNFVDEFDKQMKISCLIYQEKQKRKGLEPINSHHKKLKKSVSQMSYRIKEYNRMNPFPGMKRSNSVIRDDLWQPPKRTPEFLGRFNRLIDKHEMNNWEKVNIFFIDILFFIESYSIV